MGTRSMHEKMLDERGQSRFIGRVFVAGLSSLILLVIWFLVSVVLTPLAGDESGAMLTQRYAMLGIGVFVVGVNAWAMIVCLVRWGMQD